MTSYSMFSSVSSQFRSEQNLLHDGKDCFASKCKMAATIKDSEEDTPKRKHIKAVLVNKLEGCSDIVNMAVTIPHEDAVISVSDDK